MKRSGVGFTAATMVVGALVAGIGVAALGRGAADAVAVGVAAGVVVQLTIFWGLFVFAMPERHGLAHAVGVLVRLFALGVAAFVLVPAAGVSPAPALFSMVACLFASTLIEAFFIRNRDGGALVAGPARIGAQSR